MTQADQLTTLLSEATASLADVKTGVETIITQLKAQDLTGALASAQALSDGLAALDTEVKAAEPAPEVPVEPTPGA